MLRSAVSRFSKYLGSSQTSQGLSEDKIKLAIASFYFTLLLALLFNAIFHSVEYCNAPLSLLVLLNFHISRFNRYCD